MACELRLAGKRVLATDDTTWPIIPSVDDVWQSASVLLYHASCCQPVCCAMPCHCAMHEQPLLTCVFASCRSNNLVIVVDYDAHFWLADFLARNPADRACAAASTATAAYADCTRPSTATPEAAAWQPRSKLATHMTTPDLRCVLLHAASESWFCTAAWLLVSTTYTFARQMH
jgi:hypothetical protein